MTGSGRRTARSRVKSSTDDGEDRTLRNINPSPRLRKDRGRDHSFIRILDVNLRALLGFGILTFLIALFFINHLVKFPAVDDQMLGVITPFPAPKLIDLPMVLFLSIPLTRARTLTHTKTNTCVCIQVLYVAMMLFTD